MRSNKLTAEDIHSDPNTQNRLVEVLALFLDYGPHHIDEVWKLVDGSEADYIHKLRRCGNYFARINKMLREKTECDIGRVSRGIYQLLAL